jgi:hypothetical protein
LIDEQLPSHRQELGISGNDIGEILALLPNVQKHVVSEVFGCLVISTMAKGEGIDLPMKRQVQRFKGLLVSFLNGLNQSLRYYC